MESTEALRAAYSVATRWNDWATGAVTAGVVIELIALLLFSKDMPRNEKIALAIGSILVVIGVGGEWVFGGRAAVAAAQLQQASEERVAQLKRSQEADHRVATEAAKLAADLGVKVDTLPTFVAQKERELNNDITRFQQYAETSRSEADAAIRQLKADTDALDKARTDAQAAASQAQAELAKMQAANAPRTIPQDKQPDFVAQMKAFSGLTANIFTPPSNSPDAGPLAELLETLLKEADWKVGVGAPIGGWAKFILVCIGSQPKPNVETAATVFVLALRGVGVPAFVDKDLGPNIPLTGAGSPLPSPDMTILVGAKQ